MNNRTSLIKKIVLKSSVLTPFEAIHLKYLSRKGILNELVDIEKKANPYVSAQEVRGSLSPYMVNFIVGQVYRENPQLYTTYNYAYEELFDQDDSIPKLGYKGLALLTQLISMRHEYFVCLIFDSESKEDEQQIGNKFKEFLHTPIMDFSSYSFIHKEEVTFTEVLKTLANTFRYFIMSIDNILTLNYLLEQLIDLDDLECLQFLKMWLNNNSLKPFFNAAKICCRTSNISYILNRNHQNYVESISLHIKDLPISFGHNSLQYVKNTITKTINSIKETESKIQS